MDESLNKTLPPGECRGPGAGENQVPGDGPGSQGGWRDSGMARGWSTAAPSPRKQMASNGEGE